MKVLLRIGCEYEWLVNAETGEVLAEGHQLSAEDVLFALGYRFEIEEVDEEGW